MILGPSPAPSPPARARWLGVAAYLGLLVGGAAAFLLTAQLGERLPRADRSTASAPLAESRQPNRPPADPSGSLPSRVDVVLHVLATLAAVVALGGLLGPLCRLIGQPPVIGEVLAGICLGPSLLGACWPAAMHALVPPPAVDPGGQVTSALAAIAQLGIVLYMFLVGLELNGAQLRGRAHAAVAVSHASIVVPFVLGSALALAIYPTLAPPSATFTSFALFLGAAMAVTAFPVLARILADRGLSRTELGTVALGCAAADDVTAWCLLALVVGVARADVGGAALTIAGAAAYIAMMFLAVRPWLAAYARRFDAREGPLPSWAVSLTFVMVLLSALATEALGVHAVFGAFLLGAVIPHDSRIAHDFTAKLEDPVKVLLLPAFFAYTGLRTEIGLVSGWRDWLLCGVIVAVATAGKFGGTLLAARFTGHSWRESAALGALMNTRGLMELIVLNMGLDLGVITPTLFAMMVLMALATTLATAPLVAWLIPAPSASPPAAAL